MYCPPACEAEMIADLHEACNGTLRRRQLVRFLQAEHPGRSATDQGNKSLIRVDGLLEIRVNVTDDLDKI